MKTILIPFLFLLPSCLFSQVDTAAVEKQVDSVLQIFNNHFQERNYTNAIEFCQKAKTIAADALGTQSLIYAKCCYNEALCNYYTGEFDKAAELLIESKSIRENKLGNLHVDSKQTVMVLAVIYYSQGKYDKAEPLFHETLELQEKAYGKEHSEYAMSLSNLAVLYKATGKFDQAEKLFKETLALRIKLLGKEHPDYSGNLMNLSGVYILTGQYDKAEILLLEAMEINERISGKESLGYGDCLQNLALVYRGIGNYKKAVEFSKELIIIREKTEGKEHPNYATSLNNLASIYKFTGEFEKQEPLYKEVKSIREKVYGKESQNYAIIIHNLAVLYLDLGDFEKGERLFLEAMEIQERVLGTEHYDYASSLHNLAMLYNETKNYEKAESLFIKARDIREKILGEKHPNLLVTLDNLAKLYESQDRFSESEPIVSNILEADMSSLAFATSYQSEMELTEYMNTFNSRANKLYTYLERRASRKLNAGNLPQLAYNLSLFNKGFLLIAANRLNNLGTSSEEALEISKKLKEYRRILAAEYSKPVNDRSDIELLEEKASLTEKELARSIAGFAETNRQIVWEEVQKMLQPQEIAIEFVHFEFDFPKETDSTFYAAIVLKPEGSPQFVPLFEEKSLDSLFNDETGRKADYVNGLYTMADRGAASVETPKRSLFDILWKPLEPMLEGIKTIYYSPSGYLHRINIDAIPINDFETLADQYNLVALNSTRQLVIPKEIENKNNEIILMGGIEYEIDSTQLQSEEVLASRSRGFTAFENLDTTLRGGEWRYLPGTDQEIRSLGRILNDSDFKIETKKGFDATEEYFKSLEVDQMNNTYSPTVIHLATHGYFFPDSNENNNSDKNIFEKSKHPMLRSGLIMAGGNATWTGKNIPNQSEDGILTAYEISQMNLSNTELVVLSACETGLGDIKGNEGVYGLQRAFKIAGVKYLIMSLWQVPDKQTSLLMTNFYRNWIEEEMEIPAAFHAAQQEMRDMGFDPYQWAGFVLVE